MKKALIAFLVLSLALVLVGCNKSDDTQTTTEISTTASVKDPHPVKYTVTSINRGQSGNYIDQTIWVSDSEKSTSLKLILQDNAISYKFELDDEIFLLFSNNENGEVLVMYNIDPYSAPIWGYARIG